MQSYREIVLEVFKPLREQLAEVEAGDLEIKGGSMLACVILLRSGST